MNDFDSRFRQIHVAARRARQLQEGAPQLIETTSRKASRIALEEIKAGKVAYVTPPAPEEETTH